MGTYSHLTNYALEELRDKLVDSLTQRLTSPTSASHNARSVAYQQRPEDLRREIAAINEEIATRQGRTTRGPIHVI